jgi:hypothetical protein
MAASHPRRRGKQNNKDKLKNQHSSFATPLTKKKQELRKAGTVVAAQWSRDEKSENDEIILGAIHTDPYERKLAIVKGGSLPIKPKNKKVEEQLKPGSTGCKKKGSKKADSSSMAKLKREDELSRFSNIQVLVALGKILDVSSNTEVDTKKPKNTTASTNGSRKVHVKHEHNSSNCSTDDNRPKQTLPPHKANTANKQFCHDDKENNILVKTNYGQKNITTSNNTHENQMEYFKQIDEPVPRKDWALKQKIYDKKQKKPKMSWGHHNGKAKMKKPLQNILGKVSSQVSD